ncbi:unnamed protein product [Peronospora farinosa]|uniref:Vesicle transport protein n=1 Tax=Peronospora farinosa TaxID=134698 RepID=A0AAV0SW24_9STRA|nr:unnamed protein product [Peronospora farinosa]CAI5707376.1 unnamed protein product [Peronospora farinosa]
MMDQLKEQSKKASDKLENFAKKTQQELEKTSKKAQKSIEKAAKQTQQELEKTSKKAQECTEKAAKQAKDSINKSTEQVKKAIERDSGQMNSARESIHIDIKDKKKKAKLRRKDSSDEDTDEEDGLLHDIGDEFDQLTLNQRALCAVGCYVLSGLFAFAATVMLFTGVHHVRFYALFYSLSNVATFCSLIFIMGQNRLQKRMLSSKRSVTGRAWMGSMALTITVAFFWSSHWFIVIVLLLLQFGSMIWYSTSYIPFGRKFLHKYMAKRIVLVDAMDGKIDGK